MTRLAPPELHGFDWSGAQSAQLLNADSIRLVYERLSQVTAFLEGRVDDLEDCSWAKPLVRMAKRGEWGTLKNELLEESIDSNLSDFIKWLTHQCTTDAQVDTAIIFHDLSNWRYTFRDRSMSSFNSERLPTLRYIHPKLIEGEIVKLILIARTTQNHSPIILALGLAANFIAIHPFPDENGRAGRALLIAILRNFGIWKEHNLPLSFLLYRDRAHYLILQQSLFVEKNWAAYVRYMCSALCAAAEMSFLCNFQQHEF